MSEPEFDVDAAEAEYDAARAAGDDDGGDGDRGGDKGKGGEDPPGFKSFDDYIAGGWLLFIRSFRRYLHRS